MLLKNALHIVDASVVPKGTARVYMVRRWVLFDEAKNRPLSPPITDHENSFTDDAAAAAAYGNELAARTAEEDRRLYE